MSNKKTLELLNKKEAQLVGGGDSWQWARNLAGGAADVTSDISKKLDKWSGAPKEQEKSAGVPCTMPPELAKDPCATSSELEKYDWCTCGFKNGTTVQLKPKS